MITKKIVCILPILLILCGCCGSSCGESDKPQEQSCSYQQTQDKVSAVETIDDIASTKLSDEKKTQTAQVSQPEAQSGPTVYLFDEKGGYPDNILSDFMYFVPLISPVAVSATQSQENTQGGHLLSYTAERKGNSFYVSCEFRMKGSGWFTNKFDNDAMIEWNVKKTKKQTLKNILDYIKFEGEGYGRIEAKGTISGSKLTTESVNVYFNARGADSPVSVGLFDVDASKKTDGAYSPYNRKVARVNVLSFEKSSSEPRMGIKIAAVGASEDKLGTWAHIVGAIGNWFIPPIEIDRLGNDTMLNFGAELYQKSPTFTFPIAKNLKRLDS